MMRPAQKRLLVLAGSLLVLLLGLYLGKKWAGQAPLDAQASAQFAITDTASVDRIFIADRDGGEVLLERVPGASYWKLNGKHWARKDAVDLLLKTFLRIRVQSPVPLAQRENVIRMLAGRAKKVEIYTGGDEPAKIWYVGTATQSHTGTHMLLETPEGRGQEPFVTHMEGFTGFLSTRFFTDELEWRYTGVFDFPDRTLRGISVEFRESPQWNYALEVDTSGTLVWKGAGGLIRPVPDSQWQDHFLSFRKVHLETFKNYLTPDAVDSLAQTQPAFVLRAWGADGRRDSIALYWKAPTLETLDEQGNALPWDGARMYGNYRGEWVLCQRFVFDPLLRSPAEIQAGVGIQP